MQRDPMERLTTQRRRWSLKEWLERTKRKKAQGLGIYKVPPGTSARTRGIMKPTQLQKKIVRKVKGKIMWRRMLRRRGNGVERRTVQTLRRRYTRKVALAKLKKLSERSEAVADTVDKLVTFVAASTDEPKKIVKTDKKLAGRVLVSNLNRRHGLPRRDATVAYDKVVDATLKERKVSKRLFKGLFNSDFASQVLKDALSVGTPCGSRTEGKWKCCLGASAFPTRTLMGRRSRVFTTTSTTATSSSPC